MKKNYIKKIKCIFSNLRVRGIFSKDGEKAQARADDDGFALREKKEVRNNHE